MTIYYLEQNTVYKCEHCCFKKKKSENCCVCAIPISFLFSNHCTINVSILALNVGFCSGKVCLTKENTIIHNACFSKLKYVLQKKKRKQIKVRRLPTI